MPESEILISNKAQITIDVSEWQWIKNGMEWNGIGWDRMSWIRRQQDLPTLHYN